jgi:hypothetical protein
MWTTIETTAKFKTTTKFNTCAAGITKSKFVWPAGVIREFWKLG